MEGNGENLNELDSLGDTIKAANSGDRTALNQLRRLQIERPDLLSGAGDLGRRVQQILIEKISLGNNVVAETLYHHTETMRAELLGFDPPSPLRIAVEEVIAAWLHYWLTDAEVAQERRRKADLNFWASSASKARRSLNSAIRFLAELELLYGRQPAPTKAETIDYFSEVIDFQGVCSG